MTWSLSLSFMIFIFLSMFSGIAESAELLNEAMANFPEELLIAFGMENMDMASVLGFYGIIFLICQICLAIQAANYGFSLVSVEETDLTADFLLAKPVGRRNILTSKLLSAMTGLTLTNLVVWISSFVFIYMFRGGRAFETKPLLLLLSSIVLFQLFFLSVGLLISLLVRRVRNVTPFSMALAFGMYVLNAFGGMLGDAQLEIISPFKQFEANYIIKNAAFDGSLVLISVSVVLISMIASYALYTKRDIHSVV